LDCWTRATSRHLRSPQKIFPPMASPAPTLPAPPGEVAVFGTPRTGPLGTMCFMAAFDKSAAPKNVSMPFLACAMLTLQPALGDTAATPSSSDSLMLSKTWKTKTHLHLHVEVYHEPTLARLRAAFPAGDFPLPPQPNFTVATLVWDGVEEDFNIDLVGFAQDMQAEGVLVDLNRRSPLYSVRMRPEGTGTCTSIRRSNMLPVVFTAKRRKDIPAEFSFSRGANKSACVLKAREATQLVQDLEAFIQLPIPELKYAEAARGGPMRTRHPQQGPPPKASPAQVPLLPNRAADPVVDPAADTQLQDNPKQPQETRAQRKARKAREVRDAERADEEERARKEHAKTEQARKARNAVEATAERLAADARIARQNAKACAQAAAAAAATTRTMQSNLYNILRDLDEFAGDDTESDGEDSGSVEELEAPAGEGTAEDQDPPRSKQALKRARKKAETATAAAVEAEAAARAAAATAAAAVAPAETEAQAAAEAVTAHVAVAAMLAASEAATAAEADAAAKALAAAGTDAVTAAATAAAAPPATATAATDTVGGSDAAAKGKKRDREEEVAVDPRKVVATEVRSMDEEDLEPTEDQKMDADSLSSGQDTGESDDEDMGDAGAGNGAALGAGPSA
jgi:hypothetical protein